jgi:hypothetical protein
MLRKLLRALGALLVLVIVALVAVAANFNRVVRWAMRPAKPFAAMPEPTAPDYASPDAWSALPERADSADQAPDGFAAVSPAESRADVFYIHPTSYVGSRWNGAIDDRSLNSATDRVATMIQASAFNGCCAVWAPRYRQANGSQFTHPTADGARALELAYSDVRRAFQRFVSRRRAGRPFILAGHSQGSVLGERLLVEEIASGPLREDLVAAYLIGGRVTVEGLRERAPAISPCESPEQVRCVIAYNARGPRYVSNEFALHRDDRRPLLCTNPLTWRTDGAPAPASANLGAVFLETSDRRVRPAFADAQCSDGTLVVRTLGVAPRDFMSSLLDRVMGAQNYHPIEYQVFFMNLRENAQRRVDAMLAARR